MPKYNHHSLALNDNEEEQLRRVKKHTGYGVKKIFMAMVDALDESAPPAPATETVVTEETY